MGGKEDDIFEGGHGSGKQDDKDSEYSSESSLSIIEQSDIDEESLHEKLHVKTDEHTH